MFYGALYRIPPEPAGKTNRLFLSFISGRGAVWLARLNGVQEVGGSNPLAPTSRKDRNERQLRRSFRTYLPPARRRLAPKAAPNKKTGPGVTAPRPATGEPLSSPMLSQAEEVHPCDSPKVRGIARLAMPG